MIKCVVQCIHKVKENRKQKKERKIKMKNIFDSAAVLFDGGWRAEDRDWLISEYDFTAEEADDICELLAEL